VKLGETLSSPKNPFFFPPVSFPTPTYFLGIVPETKNDSDKLFVTMNRLMLEDPTLALTKNESTGQIVLGGLTKTHLSFLTEKLEDFGIRFHLEPLKIPYRETITKKGSGEGRYIKQSGGSGYYGVVDMTFEPAKETSFSSTVFGGHIDKGYFPAVEKGFLSALEHGPLLKAPVVGVKATLTDGKQHPVDSNEKAFSEAARICFEETAKSCGPILLEPYEEMKVNLPAEFLGPVLSDLAKRRCRILSTEEKEPGTLEIVADVPLSEILEYANEIKGLTRGSGFFNEHFLDYEPVPENKAKEILSAANS
jgi:elongation factor G